MAYLVKTKTTMTIFEKEKNSGETTEHFRARFLAEYAENLLNDNSFIRRQLNCQQAGRDIALDDFTDFFKLGKYADFVTAKMYCEEENVPNSLRLRYFYEKFEHIEKNPDCVNFLTVKNFARCCAFAEHFLGNSEARNAWKRVMAIFKENEQRKEFSS